MLYLYIYICNAYENSNALEFELVDISTFPTNMPLTLLGLQSQHQIYISIFTHRSRDSVWERGREREGLLISTHTRRVTLNQKALINLAFIYYWIIMFLTLLPRLLSLLYTAISTFFPSQLSFGRISLALAHSTTLFHFIIIDYHPFS